MSDLSLYLDALEEHRRSFAPSTSYSFDRPVTVASLKEALRAANLTICLGAGVSVPNGIPDWTTLLKRLSGHALSASDSARFIKLVESKKDISPLPLARFLKSSFTLEASFYNALYLSLYEAFDEHRPNSTMDAIVEFLSFCNSNSYAVKILTYNYDDILERRLSSILPGRYDTIINSETYRNSTRPIKIFHVHGYVPKEKPNLQFRQDVVLSEDEYHNLYVDTARWANHVQMDNFRFSTCLFIGFSMSDPSVRRLLDAVSIAGDKAEHFCVLRSTQRASSLSKADVKFYDAMIGSVLKQLGLVTIFIDEHIQIRDLLRDVMA